MTLLEHVATKKANIEDLTKGDTIAVAGSFKLHDGMLVYTKERPTLAIQKSNSVPEQESL